MPAAVITNSFILLIFLIATILFAIDPELYYRSAQEDRFLEWFTFWSFFIAAAVFLRNAADDRRRRGGIPWFAAGLGLFCLLVGLEEISWGQRLFGYQPPDYFLEQNFQQEFNLHNVVGTDVRMLGMLLVLIGYGVLMSAIATIPRIGDRLYEWHVVASPAGLIPGFGVTAAIYAWYPQSFTGEWVEAAMGLAFLGCALLTSVADRAVRGGRPMLGHVLVALIATASTLGLLRLLHGSDAERIAATRAEIAALVTDFESPRLHTRCNIHKRLYTFMREYNQPYLVRGEFSEFVVASGDTTRARYLLDPWNSPYWVRHRCTSDTTVAFVYSFGPNRRRDSTDRAIGGDDIGGFFIER